MFFRRNAVTSVCIVSRGGASAGADRSTQGSICGRSTYFGKDYTREDLSSALSQPRATDPEIYMKAGKNQPRSM